MAATSGTKKKRVERNLPEETPYSIQKGVIKEPVTPYLEEFSPGLFKSGQARTQTSKHLGKWIIKFRTGAENTFLLHAAVERGIGVSVADALKGDLNINDKQMAEALGTSESTLLRLRKAHKDLDEIASDRLVRYARIVEIAAEVFDDIRKAQSWLKRPQVGLAGKIPLDLMKSEVGAREVENLLMRIEHGVLA